MSKAWTRIKVIEAMDLTYVAAFAALCFVFTMTMIPLPMGGFTHLGDTPWMIAAMLFGGLVGGLAGAIGCSIADIVSGFGMWAPFTVLIKFVSAMVCGHISNGRSVSRNVIGAAVAGPGLNAILYTFVYAWLFGWPAAIAFYPFCATHTIVGIVISTSIVYGIGKSYPQALDVREVVMGRMKRELRETEE